LTTSGGWNRKRAEAIFWVEKTDLERARIGIDPSRLSGDTRTEEYMNRKRKDWTIHAV